MSVALFDLKCPSYDYVKRMSWSEFLIRLYGFKRLQEREVMMLRELSWLVYSSPHNDPKKMKRNIEAFWPIKSGKSKRVDASMIEKMKEATKLYLEQKKQRDG